MAGILLVTPGVLSELLGVVLLIPPLRAVVKRLPLPRTCECEHALRHALITPAALVPEAVKRELQPVVGRYLR